MTEDRESNVNDRASLVGELAPWPSRRRLAEVLRKAGLKVVVGNYSIRVNVCRHFVFQEYGGDLGTPVIDADADSAEAMLRGGQLVSQALTRAGVRHRFEIYDLRDEMVGYLHHEWAC
jgi:hypothetical protein